MSNTPNCPEVATLKNFLSGDLDEARVRNIESHLDNCSPCGDTVRSLQVDDTLFRLARNAAVQQGSSAENLIVDDLIARYRDLPAEQQCEDVVLQEEDVRQARIQEVEARLCVRNGEDEIGRLGHYRLLRLLGVGGMGVVYLAEDSQLKRMVALKILRPSLGRAARQRFLLEARAAAGVEHDHVVTIYQVGEENQLAYMAMQWLDGETLEGRLKREEAEENRLSTEEVTRIGRQLALGLAAAHEQSVVHRDIKPANVWLEANRDRARILDFGLARAVNENPQLTETGMIAGTPAYMSPEQARGEVIDQRSDLFSVGCLLYRMVTGRLPFEAPNPLATILAIQSNQPTPPRALNAAVSDRLSSIILWLLEKNPSERLQSASKLAELLNEPHGKSVHQSTGHQPRHYTETNSRLTRPSLGRGAFVALCLLLLGGFFAAPTIYRVVTGQGLLVIESNDPDLRVMVLKDGKEVRIVDGKNNSVNIAAGAYDLKVQAPTDVRLEKNSVILSVGAKETVRIMNEPKGNFAKKLPKKKPSPGSHIIQAGDILGVFIEGVVGNEGTSPPVHLTSDTAELPTMGFPMPVDGDGKIALPLVEPIRIAGMKIEEARAAIVDAFEKDHNILEPGNSIVFVSLIRPGDQLSTSPNYKVQPGSILGIFIEGVLGGTDQPIPINMPNKLSGLPPTSGFPIVVQQNGKITLPLVDPIDVRGKNISEVRARIINAYDGKVFNPGEAMILVSLIRPHDFANTVNAGEYVDSFGEQRSTDPAPYATEASASTIDEAARQPDNGRLHNQLAGYWKIVGMVNDGKKVDAVSDTARVLFTDNKLLFLENGKLESEGDLEIEAGERLHQIRFGSHDVESRLGILELNGDYVKMAFRRHATSKVSPTSFDDVNLSLYMLVRDASSSLAKEQPGYSATDFSNRRPTTDKQSSATFQESLQLLRHRLLAAGNDGRGPRHPEIESAITSITGYEPIHIKNLSFAIASLQPKQEVDYESDRWVGTSPAIHNSIDLEDKHYTTIRWTGAGDESEAVQVLRAPAKAPHERALIEGCRAVATIHIEDSKPSLYISVPTATAAKVGQLTRENIGKHLMALIDGRVVLVAPIQAEVSNDIRLSGQFTVEKLKAIASRRK